VEAVIQIGVQLPADVGLEQLAEMQTAFSDEYPQRQERRRSAPPGPGGSEASSRLNGYTFRSASGQHVVGVQLDSFGVSWLQPYATWGQFRERARQRWHDYRRFARPSRITKLRVRYLNRIEVPAKDSLEHYLLTRPHLSEGLQRYATSSFFFEIVLDLPGGTTAAITEAIENRVRTPGMVGLILDIDVSRPHEAAGDDESIWAVLDELRAQKNNLFFKSITTKARRMFT
jgi:uncharacterized protein (TIGR04255 family)